MLSVSTPNGKDFIRAGPFIFNERILTDIAFPNPEPTLCGIDDKAGKRRALLNFFVARVALIQDGFGRAEGAVERGDHVLNADLLLVLQKAAQRIVAVYAASLPAVEQMPGR